MLLYFKKILIVPLEIYAFTHSKALHKTSFFNHETTLRWFPAGHHLHSLPNL